MQLPEPYPCILNAKEPVCFAYMSAPSLLRLRIAIWGILSLLLVLPCLAQRVHKGAYALFFEAHTLYTNTLYAQATERFAIFRELYPGHISAPDALYYQAEASLRAGYTEEAVTLFTQFGQQHSVHPLASRIGPILGRHFSATGNLARATRLLPLMPPEMGAQTLYWMATSARATGEMEQAQERYERAARDYPGTEAAPMALYALGILHFNRQDYNKAATVFQELRTTYPDSPSSRDIGLTLAEIHHQVGNYSDVIADVRRRMQTLPATSRERALFLLADSHNRLRQSEQAIIYYQQILNSSIFRRQALYGIGWAYHYEGAYEWATNHFEEAIGDQSDELALQATYYAGINALLAGRQNEATRFFQRVADGWPQNELADHALYEKGLIAYAQSRWQEAYDSFSHIVDTPMAGDALVHRGYAAIALNDLDLAYNDFEDAIALGAADPSVAYDVLFQKGWNLYNTGNFGVAGPSFFRLYEDYPNADKAGSALFWAAESYYQLGNHEHAESLFRRYLHDFGSGEHVTDTYYALGWLHFKQQRFDAAIRAFETYVRRSGGRGTYLANANLRLGDSHYALKQFGEAIRHYRRVSGEGEDYALYQTGQSYSHQGKIAQAIRTFNSLMNAHPDSPYLEESQYALGYVYFQTQDYNQAIAAYQTLIRLFPEDPLAAKAQYGIGDALFNDGRLSEAIEAYTQVLTHYPSSPFVGDAATSIQYAMLGAEDTTAAQGILDNFIRHNPSSPVVPELLFRQAEAIYEGGQLEEALAAFRLFVETHPTTEHVPEAQYYIGSIHHAQDRMAEAETAFRHILQVFPQSIRAHEAASMLGRMLLRQNRNTDALEVYRLFESYTTNDRYLLAQARYGQAQTLLNLGQTEKAEDVLRPLIETQADNNWDTTPAMLGMARVYEVQKRMDEAISLLHQVVQYNQEEIGAEALYHLGRVLLASGDTHGAIEELNRMSQLFAAFPDYLAKAYMLQAQAFRKLGQTGEALRLYDHLITEFEGSSYAEEAQQEKDSL